MKKIEDLSYGDIFDYGLPFKRNIRLNLNTLQSLIDNDKFEKFNFKCQKKLLQLVSKYLTNEKMAVAMGFVLTNQDDQMVLKYDANALISGFCSYLNNKFDYYYAYKNPFVDPNYSSLIKGLKEVFQKKKKDLMDAKNMDDIKKYSLVLYNFLIEKIGKEFIEATDENYLSYYFEKVKLNEINNLNKLINNLDVFFEKVDKTILDYDIFEYINKKKLMLYLSKQYFEYMKFFSVNNDNNDNLIQIGLYIWSFFNEFDHSDTITINDIYYDEFYIENDQVFARTTYKKKYSNYKLKKEFDDFLKQNLKLREQLEKLSKYDKIEFGNMSILEINNYIKDILASARDNWQEVNEVEINNEINSMIEMGNEVSYEEAKKIKLISQKISVLLKNKPIKVIKGIDTFYGYYGFIYPNGRIILEALYDDESKKKVASGKALYSMDLNKFREYAKLKKRELMAKSDVSRLVHIGDWEEKFIKLIIGDNKSKDLSELEYIDANIDSIVNLEELNKCLEQLDRLDKILPKDKVDKERKKVKVKRKKVVLNNFREELENNPASEFVTMQEKQDFESTQGELLTTIDSNNFVDFLLKYYDLLKENKQLKEKRNRLKRNPAVAAYTKKRAKCTCDLCGDRYLDTYMFDSHHLLSLKDGGPDNIYNTVCLCTRCHRIAHATGFNDNQMYILLDKIKGYLEKDEIPEEYVQKFYQTFQEYLKMYDEENFFMKWNRHKK